MRTEKPLNCYKNQIVIEECDTPSERTFILFRSKKRHVVRFCELGSVLDKVRELVEESHVNAIHCDLDVLARIQHDLLQSFPHTRFWFAPNFVIDITNPDEQKEIIISEHCRAHRGAQNVTEAILRDYYFPKMGKRTREIIANCSVCLKSKYVRHPIKQSLGTTPIPTVPGERIHVDIYSTDGKYFMTAVDKFSKFAFIQLIATRSIVDVIPAVIQIVNIFPNIKFIYCDNEASLNSLSMEEVMNRFNISLSNSPPFHTSSNGQVERFHSTLSELSRCLKVQRQISDTTELLLLATVEYNRTIHSVTRERPVDVFFNCSELMREKVKKNLIDAQDRQNRLVNRRCHERSFDLGQIVYIKTNKRLGNKLTSRYVPGRIEADLGSTVLVDGKIIHKDNIR